MLDHVRLATDEATVFAENQARGYERFHLETHEVPPRRKQPYPFNPHPSKIRLAEYLLREVFEYGFKLRRREYRKVLLSRPCIYGVFDGRFGGFHPIKERCTGCMRCVQEYPGICRVDRNPEFFTFADSYWIPLDQTTASTSPVAIVSYEAETGEIPVKGMGYRGGFAEWGWDSIWTDMSEIVRPTRDGVYGREYISTLVDFGRKPKFIEFSAEGPRHVSRTISIPIPIIFDCFPSNLNNRYVLASIAAASKRVGTLFIASPEQTKDVSDDQRRQMVPILSSLDLNQNANVVSHAPAVELTGFDATAVEKIREISPHVPICVRLQLTRKADDLAVDLARNDIDAIHLLADYHGEPWDGSTRFISDLIRSVHRTLVKEGLRDEVTLVASGGITLAEHVPKAILCGADLIALDTTVLVALQAQFMGECESADKGRIRAEKFDPAWGEQRLVNLMASWHDQLIEILSAMGMRDVRRLRGDAGRGMFRDELEKEAFADIIHRT